MKYSRDLENPQSQSTQLENQNELIKVSKAINFRVLHRGSSRIYSQIDFLSENIAFREILLFFYRQLL